MQDKKKIILSSILVLLLVTTACSQPVNLSGLMAPFRDMLQQVFEYVEVPETDEKDPEIYSQPDLAVMPEEAFLEETLTPPQVPTEQIEKPPTPTMISDPQGTIIYTCQVDKNPSHDQICKINPDGSGFKQLTENM
ncbi:MAG: hypothetical protein Q7J07_05210 [Pelolinea sp.]|nr:hypothetical protein [Pelolinea sp.]